MNLKEKGKKLRENFINNKRKPLKKTLSKRNRGLKLEKGEPSKGGRGKYGTIGKCNSHQVTGACPTTTGNESHERQYVR